MLWGGPRPQELSLGALEGARRWVSVPCFGALVGDGGVHSGDVQMAFQNSEMFMIHEGNY